MHLRALFLAAITALQTSAAPSIRSDIPFQGLRGSLSTNSNQVRSICSGNTATNRSQWCEYDTDTNYYQTWPETGVVRDFYFELTNTTAAPDGVERIVLSVNGMIPGPTIEANWGDTVRVHVTNSLTANGTSIHFHGVRQYLSNSNDGVISITQCPTPPGHTVTYEFKCTQYGSSWYHSHYALQAWDGVFGGIVIHGPATANYDEDLGSLFLNDWTHETFSALYTYAETHGPPPVLDTGLINGTNVYNEAGSRFETTFASGKSYLIRLVNGAIDTHWDFSIDNHTLTVIGTDFVPIVPYNTSSISIGIGQRYDIVVTADQGGVASDFWMRAVPDAFCSTNANGDNIRGIVHYDGSKSEPTTTGYTISESDCAGESSASISPYLALDAVSSGDVFDDKDVEPAIIAGLSKWLVGNSSFLVQWGNPTALQIVHNDTTSNSSQNVIELPRANEWMILVIETGFAVPHPIHLHGHDFYQLAAGAGTYTDAAPTLEVHNPPRRDVAMLPASGYLVIGFYTDNPGIWLAHCHIGWHTEEGLALQFVERRDEITALYDVSELESECDAWNSYQSSSALMQDDSGI